MNMTAPIDRQNAQEKPSGLAILLSAVVFPGVGQYLQGRRLAAGLYAAVFLLCVVPAFVAIFKPLFWNLRMLSSFPNTAEPIDFQPILWANILFWIALSALVYLANLLDAFVYHRRQVADWLKGQDKPDDLSNIRPD